MLSWEELLSPACLHSTSHNICLIPVEPKSFSLIQILTWARGQSSNCLRMLKCLWFSLARLIIVPISLLSRGFGRSVCYFCHLQFLLPVAWRGVWGLADFWSVLIKCLKYLLGLGPSSACAVGIVKMIPNSTQRHEVGLAELSCI